MGGLPASRPMGLPANSPLLRGSLAPQPGERIPQKPVALTEADRVYAQFLDFKERLAAEKLPMPTTSAQRVMLAGQLTVAWAARL